MKKFLILFSIALILFSCDRFEHTFEHETNNENYIIDFFNTFADSIETILPSEDVSNIMEYFHNDYSNNGLDKTDVEDFYKIFYAINMPLTFEATLIDTSDTNIDWRLLVTESSSGTTFMDTLITDVLIETEDSFQFYGNQADMRNVVVELFTGQWCPNCPNAEEALHNLRMQYGSRFSYVEYHYIDDLESEFVQDLFNYYPNNGSLPFGIVNGNEHLLYSANSISEAQAEIEAAITPLLLEPLKVLLTDVQTDLSETLLTGSVQIDIDPSIVRDNLNLVAVLMEDYNEEYTNNHGEPHYNIALKRITIDISTINQSDSVEFEIAGLDELPIWYTDGLPEDLTLVIWVQRLDQLYDEGTCAAYNVIEVSL